MLGQVQMTPNFVILCCGRTFKSMTAFHQHNKNAPTHRRLAPAPAAQPATRTTASSTNGGVISASASSMAVSTTSPDDALGEISCTSGFSFVSQEAMKQHKKDAKYHQFNNDDNKAGRVCLDCGVKFSSIKVLECHKREAPQHQIPSADGVADGVDKVNDSNNESSVLEATSINWDNSPSETEYAANREIKFIKSECLPSDAVETDSTSHASSDHTVQEPSEVIKATNTPKMPTEQYTRAPSQVSAACCNRATVVQIVIHNGQCLATTSNEKNPAVIAGNSLEPQSNPIISIPITINCHGGTVELGQGAIQNSVPIANSHNAVPSKPLVNGDTDVQQPQTQEPKESWENGNRRESASDVVSLQQERASSVQDPPRPSVASSWATGDSDRNQVGSSRSDDHGDSRPTDDGDNKPAPNKHRCTCGKVFASFTTLEQHKVNSPAHRNEHSVALLCSCGKKFSHKYQLSQHKKQFIWHKVVCDCGAQSKDSEAMEQHRVTSKAHRGRVLDGQVQNGGISNPSKGSERGGHSPYGAGHRRLVSSQAGSDIAGARNSQQRSSQQEFAPQNANHRGSLHVDNGSVTSASKPASSRPGKNNGTPDLESLISLSGTSNSAKTVRDDGRDSWSRTSSKQESNQSRASNGTWKGTPNAGGWKNSRSGGKPWGQESSPASWADGIADTGLVSSSWGVSNTNSVAQNSTECSEACGFCGLCGW